MKERSHEYNLSMGEFQRTGWVNETFLKKTDFDSFFTRVKRATSFQAMEWLVSSFLAVKGTRRGKVVIPMKFQNHRSEAVVAFTRSFGAHLRNQARDIDPPRFQNTKVTGEFCNIMDVNHLCQILQLEYDTSALMYGSWLVTWTDGTIQGSSLAPGVCLTVAAFLEYQVYNINFAFDPCVRVTYSMMRWVDDALMVVGISSRKGFKGNAADLAELVFQRLTERYSEEFHLKTEDHSIFIGHRLEVDNGCVYTAYPSEIDLVQCVIQSYRYHHFTSGVSTAMKRSLLVGQSIRVIDLCMRDEDAINGLLHLWLEFLVVGFPVSWVTSAKSSIVARHPYLMNVLNRAIARLYQVRLLHPGVHRVV